MKKLVMTVAVLTCAASFVSAQTVTSANVVGFVKGDKPVGLRILGQNWQDDTLQNLMGLDHKAAKIPTVAQRVHVYDTTEGYITYFCWADSFVQLDSGVEWRNVADPNSSIGDVSLANAISVFLATPTGGGGEIILAGEVNPSEYATNNVVGALQLLSFPFSVSVDSLNDLALTDAGTPAQVFGGGSVIVPTTADLIHLYGATGYTSYFLYDDGFGTREWRYVDFPNDSIPPEEMAGLALGEGFFYFAQSSFQWIEQNPYFGNL